jgi:hypothetical protein
MDLGCCPTIRKIGTLDFGNLFFYANEVKDLQDLAALPFV